MVIFISVIVSGLSFCYSNTIWLFFSIFLFRKNSDNFNKYITCCPTYNDIITSFYKTYFLKLQDIDRIRMINSNNYDNYYRRPMPWGSHYYYMICLKNNDEYIVTRLTVCKLEKILNVRIVYKRVFFPYITKTILNRTKNI